MNCSRIPFIWLAAALLAVMMPSWSAADAGCGDAGQPGEFLSYGTSVRSLGMGRTAVALIDDAGSIFHNPAGLMRMDRQWNAYLMHFDPFYASRYNAFAVAVSRPDKGTDGIGRFFLGSHSALGIGLVELRSDDYDYRDAADSLMGTFGIYQQAFLAAFARRTVTTWGIFDYGADFKVIRQGISGLNGYDAHTGAGIDVGAQMQMIHPWPFTDIFPLRQLLPLRLGVTVQNLIKPKGGLGKSSESYPTTLRFGGSYLIDLPREYAVLVACDGVKQYWKGRGMGWHLGTELQWKSAMFAIAPRLGGVYQNDKVTFTTGLGFTFIKDQFALQVDFAQGFHSELNDDQRLSLRVIFGAPHGADHFAARSQASQSIASRNFALESIGRYPVEPADQAVEGGEIILGQAQQLATALDTVNAVRVSRYYDFVGGCIQARKLLTDARTLLRQSKFAEAEGSAAEAVTEFQGDCDDGDGQAEAHIIIAIAALAQNHDDAAAADHAGQALAKLGSEGGSATQKYLRGICYTLKKDWTGAYSQFRGITGGSEDIQSLAQVGAAYCLANGAAGGQEVATTIAALEEQIADYDWPLSDAYLPYPVVPDRNLADNAQCLIGCLYAAQGQAEPAAAAFAKVFRFYPHRDISAVSGLPLGCDKCTFIQGQSTK
jgi:hypothetical protein